MVKACKKYQRDKHTLFAYLADFFCMTGNCQSILLFVKEEVLLCRIVGPDVFYGVIYLPFVLQLLKVLYYFK